MDLTCMVTTLRRGRDPLGRYCPWAECPKARTTSPKRRLGPMLSAVEDAVDCTVLAGVQCALLQPWAKKFQF